MPRSRVVLQTGSQVLSSGCVAPMRLLGPVAACSSEGRDGSVVLLLQGLMYDWADVVVDIVDGRLGALLTELVEPSEAQPLRQLAYEVDDVVASTEVVGGIEAGVAGPEDDGRCLGSVQDQEDDGQRLVDIATGDPIRSPEIIERCVVNESVE